MNRFYYKSKFISHKIISLYRTNEGEWRFVCTAIDVSSWLPAKTSAIGSFLPPVTRKMLLAICPIRSDRDRDGGGVLLAIKNNVTF